MIVYSMAMSQTQRWGNEKKGTFSIQWMCKKKKCRGKKWKKKKKNINLFNSSFDTMDQEQTISELNRKKLNERKVINCWCDASTYSRSFHIFLSFQFLLSVCLFVSPQWTPFVKMGLNFVHLLLLTAFVFLSFVSSCRSFVVYMRLNL